MDGAISDPSDWLQTSLSSFSGLENALRCQVCKDFYATPMMTSCSHTFCSMCIRRCLSNDGKCPTCRSSDQASKLRRNWSLEEVVGTFQAARPTALGIATNHKKEREEAPARPGKRRRVAQQHDGVAEGPSSQAQTRQTRSQRRKMTESIEVQDDSDGDYAPEDGLVACPICDKRMKEEAVFSHIGTSACTTEDSSSRPTPVTQKPPSRPSTAKPQERLAELNYSLLNEKALRKKLQELGIPASGPKAVLCRRHTEWVNLWNSNCDASNPRTKRELLDDLRKWDRAQGEQARDPEASSGGGVMKKDFDAGAWAEENKSDFSRLIAEARKKKQAATKPAAVEASNAEDANATDESHPSAQKPAQKIDVIDEQPYENNPEAMSSIRDKVEAANTGQHIEPLLNKDYDAPTHLANPGHSQTGLRVPALQRDASLPQHFNTPTRKIPMFEVPSQPVADVDNTPGEGR